jgi:hypothetical protein
MDIIDPWRSTSNQSIMDIMDLWRSTSNQSIMDIMDPAPKVSGSKAEGGLARLRKNFKILLANTSLYHIFTNTTAIKKPKAGLNPAC